MDSYARALLHLQRAATSNRERQLEDAIAAADNLGLVEWLLRTRYPEPGLDKGCFTHWAGIAALISARTPARKPSELICASIYTAGIRTFYPAAFTDTPSLFEARHWMDADPPSVDVAPVQLSRLRKLAHQLFICLPRLMHDVRALHTGGPAQPHAAVLTLAEALLRFEDKAAENWLLHRVGLAGTTNHDDRRIVSTSFLFPSISEMDAVVQYWQTRLMALRLYAVLTPDRANTTSDEELRLAKNICMTWQYAAANRPLACMSMPLALLTVWNAVRHKERPEGFSKRRTRAWVRQSISRSFVPWMFGESVADLDAAANVLSGGPLFEYTRSLFQA